MFHRPYVHVLVGFFFTSIASSIVANDAVPRSQPMQDSEETKRIRKILGDEYPQFVKELGENIKDPKFLAALNSGDALYDKIPFDHNVEYACFSLIPTQNEIDVDKSLAYPLSIDPYGKKAGGVGIPQYLTGGTFAPGGPIITAGGKYIIDGHHRWSQLYLINPLAKIKAINMQVNDPIEALKFTQMAIASITQKIPSALVEGKNLMTMTEEDFAQWIRKNLHPDAIAAFKERGIDGFDAIFTHIWDNAKLMKAHNAPILKAPNRGLMPQTGGDPKKGIPEPKGWEAALEAGKIDVRHDVE